MMDLDPSKLDKMKVVELKAELTARGLDTKGVKAILVERLKAALEASSTLNPAVSVDSEINTSPPVQAESTQFSNVTPTRSKRGKRTRSKTHSPSPVKKFETEATYEPEISSQATIDSLSEVPSSSQTLTSNEEFQQEIDDEPFEEKEEPTEQYNTDMEETFLPPTEMANPDEVECEENEIELAEKQVIEEIEESEENEENEENEEEEPQQSMTYELNETVPADDIVKETSNENFEEESVSYQEANDVLPMEVSEEKEEESETATMSEEQTVTQDAQESLEDAKEETSNTENRKRKISKSKSRSRTRSQSKSRSRSRSVSKSRKSRSPSKRTKSRSRSVSSLSRHLSRKSLEPNTDDFVNEEDEPTIEDKQFGLSWFDSDLHLRIDPITFNSAKPLHEDVFGVVWSGARTNFGVKTGQVMYEVRLSGELNCKLRGEKYTHGFRCGFSTCKTNLMLGEAENSFAFCHTGKKADKGEFNEYGKPFGLDDVIGCYLNLESSPCTIEFTLNGKSLGTAFEFDKDVLEDEALFPHVLTKGYEFQVNFADNENLLANVERPKREKVRSHSTTLAIEKDANEKHENQQKESNEEENWDEELTNKDKTEKMGEDNDELKEKSEEKEDEKMSSIEEEIKEEEEEKKEVVKEKVDEENDETIENIEESNNSEEKEEELTEQSPVELLPNYEMIALISDDLYVSGPQRPETRKECEVLLLVGLPGAGKTYWAANVMKENPEKQYYVIGPDNLIDKMTIEGKPRKKFHNSKWDDFYELCIKSVATLEEIATKRRRNFILDQTNVFASCQRRKMKGFGDFKRIAIVFIPSEDELKRRNDLKTEAQGINLVKESTLNRLKANFTLPSVEFGWFDEVRFTELEGEEAKTEVKKYNEKGKKAIQSSTSSSSSRYKRPRRDDYYRRGDNNRRRDDRRRNDYQGSSRWRNDQRGGSRWGSAVGNGQSQSNRGRNWRDDNRNFSGRGGSGGATSGGYDRRNSNNRYSGGSSGSNWVSYNSRPPNRYDDRLYKQQSSSGSGSRYDNYSSGGSSRNYGGRDHRNDRDRKKDESSDSRGNRRDFHAGHRDNRSGDSRGGYERSSSSKTSKDAYDYGNKGDRSSSSHSKNANGNSSQGKWISGHQQQQQRQNWAQCPPVAQHQQQLQQQQQQQQTASNYWGYDQMQGYGTQAQWSMNSADPRQQQQWMNWWQGGNDTSAMRANSQQTQPPHHQQQYWAQYSQHQQMYPMHSVQTLNHDGNSLSMGANMTTSASGATSGNIGNGTGNSMHQSRTSSSGNRNDSKK